MSSLYADLEIQESASADDVKRAYRALSLQWHPDRNPDPTATARFQTISRAYETLGDETKRREYDDARRACCPHPPPPSAHMHQQHHHHHHHAFAAMNEFIRQTQARTASSSTAAEDPFAVPRGMMSGFFNNVGECGDGDFVQQIHIFHNGVQQTFHMGGARQQQQGGASLTPLPIVQSANITLETAYCGGVIDVPIQRWTVTAGERTSCTTHVSARVPPGARDQQMIVLENQGNVIDGHAGIVKLILRLQPHPLFKLVGDRDLLFHKSISLRESLCGLDFQIPFLDGRSFTVNNFVQNADGLAARISNAVIAPGEKKIIAGLGLPDCTGGGAAPGNLHVEFAVQFPAQLQLSDDDRLALADLLDRAEAVQ